MLLTELNYLEVNSLILNILLGQATGRLTVTIVPADAEAGVTVSSGGGITTSASTVTGSQTGVYIFYLPPGLCTINATATGYKPVDPQSVTIVEGGEHELAFDFTAAGEIPVAGRGMSPYSCINTGEVPVRYFVEEFTGTGTIEFICRSTGEVASTVSVDESNLNSITIPSDEGYIYDIYGPALYYLSFTINTTAMPLGYYDVRLTHSPPVISGSSTTTEEEFYISDTIQGAIDAAYNSGVSIPEEIITPWSNKFDEYRKVYIPAGNYYYATATDHHKAMPVPYIAFQSYIYLQGAGRDTTILDAGNNSPTVGNGFVFMRANSIVLDGFTVKGCNGTNGTGVRFGGVSSIYAFNNRIENNVYGIGYDSGLTPYIFNNIITNNSEYGIYFPGSASDNINIGNNVIAENRGGIYIDSCTGYCSIKENNIYKNTAYPGICMPDFYGFTCDITGNVISENNNTGTVWPSYGGGIYIYNSYNGVVNIINNEITKNTAPLGGGIYFSGSTPSSNITGNNIYGNTATTPTGGNQLYCTDTPAINADNNWWNVTVNDTEVFQVTDPGVTQTVDVGTPATTQFPVPDVPAI